ncbi:helix-turn-helix domain-containing protein [Microcoleus sp. B4-C1]|uniref:helix-turn-helix domain-containing protein n=1 Tax=Microcoleus sp. B4-C1 TaxID=2818660 RepID=UPI002FD0F935
MNCEITLGRLIKNARLYQSMSQIELAQKLTDRTGRNVTFCEVSRIENDCADIPYEEWRWLIPALAAVFETDKAWFQKIHDSTHTQTLDPSQAIFPVYLP